MPDQRGKRQTVKLDAQQLLVGDGAVNLLGDAPERLFFSHSGDDASVHILVGRNAITTS